MTSRTTRGEDTGEKFQIYQDVWKVREYVLFDPREEYLTPSLRGYRLADGVYRPIPILHDQLASEVLGLRLEREGVRLVFREPETGRLVLRPHEERLRQERPDRELTNAKLSAMEEEIEELVEGQKSAAAELDRLRRELDALRKQQPSPSS
ncbi:MAG: hypothetical protein JWO38_2245 [Gemmataceae bacterium]|nr:hypothetical protein [Gemmataceae bacterium]